MGMDSSAQMTFWQFSVRCNPAPRIHSNQVATDIALYGLQDVCGFISSQIAHWILHLDRIGILIRTFRRLQPSWGCTTRRA